MLRWLAAWFLGLGVLAPLALAQPAANPPQIPLCMVGDSISWATEAADSWRADLLKEIPTLAFIGTHSGSLGYSHAAEGGNSTMAVLGRMSEIPDCAYYHLLIGTNDGRGKTEAERQERAKTCANRIVRIVQGLLAKPHAKAVFLGSILPCDAGSPRSIKAHPQMEQDYRDRDQTNSDVNALLRPEITKLFPDGRVVWVEYEKPVRATPNWQPIIQLHPTLAGYRLLAPILAQAIREKLRLGAHIADPKPVPGAGVRVVNLWDEEAMATATPVLPGWYTVSFHVGTVQARATVTLTGAGTDPKQVFKRTLEVPAGDAGKRLTLNIFTGAAQYGYTTGIIRMTADHCAVDRILFEKKRPSSQASVYGRGSYLDTTSPISLGEWVEK